MATHHLSASFCDLDDATPETSFPSSASIWRGPPPQATHRRGPLSPIQGPTPPRLDVDWSDSPPLSLSLRFSGLFSDADLAVLGPDGAGTKEGDLTRRTHESHSVSLDMSYDVQTFPNLKDVAPDFSNDSDITEVLFMTPKLPATLSTIPEAIEPSPVLNYTTSLSDFDILNIGHTTEAGTSVMLCKRRKTGNMYKVRFRRDHFPWTEQDVLETLRDLGAPFLPHLRGLFREDGRVYLVLDHLAAGSLRDLVDRAGALTTQRIMFYASEIVVGLENLHSIGIIHRNVNPDDIMFDSSGHVVISNFEYADMVGPSGQNTTSLAPFSGQSSGLLGYGGDFMAQQPRTQCYQAPEVLLGWSHDCVVDCWGFGMVLYYMYFGKHPFKIGVGPEGSDDLKARVIEGTLSPDSLRLIHPQTRDIILKCIERNPRVRLGLEDVKKHGFFSNVSWAKVADRLVEVPPFPGSYEIQTTREHAAPNRYSSMSQLRPSASTNNIQQQPTTLAASNPHESAIQLSPPVDVKPLRIEKKTSRSPVMSPNYQGFSGGGAVQVEPLQYYQGREAEGGYLSPNSRSYRTLPRVGEVSPGRSREDGDDNGVGRGRDTEEYGHGIRGEVVRDSVAGGAAIWDILDQEDEDRDRRAMSSRASTVEYGRRSLFSFFKGKGITKNQGRSASGSGGANRMSGLYPKNLLMNFSTVSFGRLKKGKGTKSPGRVASSAFGGGSTVAESILSSAEQYPASIPPVPPLPVGLQQIGSGIGFQYSPRAGDGALEGGVMRSKVSICSGTTPRGCYNALIGARGYGQGIVGGGGGSLMSGAGVGSPKVRVDVHVKREEEEGPFGYRGRFDVGQEKGNLKSDGEYQHPHALHQRENEHPEPLGPGETYHVGNSAAWIVPCIDAGLRVQSPVSSPSLRVDAAAVQAYRAGGAGASPSHLYGSELPELPGSAASSPSSGDGPFTPTAVGCDTTEGGDLHARGKERYGGVDEFGEATGGGGGGGGPHEGMREMDMTVRLVTSGETRVY